MKFRFLIPFSLIMMLIGLSNNHLVAQNNKYFYKYYDSSSVGEVQFDTPAELKFKQWESNHFLFEYHLKVSNIPRNMYLSLLKTNRYNLQFEQTSSLLKVFVEKAAFRIFSSSSGQAEENIVLTVYYPEEFDISGETLKRR